MNKLARRKLKRAANKLVAVATRYNKRHNRPVLDTAANRRARTKFL